MKKIRIQQTSINTTDTIERSEGETIEMKIERILNNNDGISEGADTLYTDRQDGVPWQTNVRSDRWEIGIEAKDQQTKTYITSREERMAAKEGGNKTDQNDGKNQET